MMGFIRLHRFAVPMLLMGACCASGQAQAQASEAKRYTSVQGIEMIQSRGASMNRMTSASSSAAGGKYPAGVVGAVPTGWTAPQHFASRVTVSPPEQAARDRDRMAVLKQELDKELALLQSQATTLNDRELRSKVGPDEVKRMEYMQALHEQNVKALTAEMRRAGG